MTIRRWQIGLVTLGVLLLVVAALILVNDVNPRNYPGIALWLVGALVVHDAVVAAAVFGVSVMMRRVGRRIPAAVIAIVQGSLVVAAIMFALVVPEIVKKQIGTANPTILPLDYALNLALFSAALVVATGAAVGAYLLLAQRRQRRSSNARV
ncbi:MAG: hypothetical protein ACRCSP_01235 [Rhodoglobus sp.]